MVLIAHSFVFLRLSDVQSHKLCIISNATILFFFLEDELLENAILSKKQILQIHMANLHCPASYQHTVQMSGSGGKA